MNFDRQGQSFVQLVKRLTRFAVLFYCSQVRYALYEDQFIYLSFVINSAFRKAFDARLQTAADSCREVSHCIGGTDCCLA